MGFGTPPTPPCVVWLDPMWTVLSLLDQTTGTGYSALDLSSYVSATTIAVILEIYVKIDSIEAGAYAQLYAVMAGDPAVGVLRLRKAYDDGARAGAFSYEQGIVAVDANQCIDYMTSISGTLQADFYINLLGYIQTG